MLSDLGDYLHATASLVPKWVPPSQMFWAVATTILFALAAVALLTNRVALLATRLLTMMLVIFGLLVWVPLLDSDPHKPTNWGEFAETTRLPQQHGFWLIRDGHVRDVQDRVLVERLADPIILGASSATRKLSCD